MVKKVITANNISEFIASRKRKLEFEFQRDYLVWTGASQDSIQSAEDELTKATEEFEKFETEIHPISNSLIFPKQIELDSLTKKLKEFRKEELFSAMRAKSGNAYGILKKRGTILKANFENRFRIGKLNIILLKLKDKKKTNLTNAIISGSKITDVTISFVKDKEDRLKLCRILSRLGLGSPNEKTSFEEVEMNLGNKKVWVPSEMSEKINELNEKFCKISQKIQFKNAEKQIRIFSDVEENEFSKLQTEYLEILKEQDRILKNFEDDPGEFTISS